MWKHSDQKNVSLHDCWADRVIIEGDDLYFEFRDGFWIIQTNEDGPACRTLRSDCSRLRLRGCEAKKLCIVKRLFLFSRPLYIKQVPLTLEKLTRNINRGRWKLEFLNERHTERGVQFECWLWSGRRHAECRLAFGCSGMEYLWNNLCEDRPW